MVCILFYFDHIWVFELPMSSSRDIPIPLLNQPIIRIGTSDNSGSGALIIPVLQKRLPFVWQIVAGKLA